MNFYYNFFSPLWQLIKRQHINKYVKSLFQNQYLSKEDIEKIQFLKLKKLISFCEHYVPYYMEMFKTLNISCDEIKCFDDLKKIPTLSKEIVRTRYKDFIPNIYVGKYQITKTSGSTGISTSFRVSKDAAEHWYAAKLYGRMINGINPGDPLLWIWGERKNTKKSFFYSIKLRLKQYIEKQYKISAFDITEENAIKISELIKRRKIVAIYGYSSAIYEFSLILKRKNIYLPLKHIFATSEKLYDYQRMTISEVFKCPVSVEYGGAEMGILAFECNKGGFHIIEENVYMEAIDINKNDDDMPNYNNLKSIVITDLNNFSMPLLRYESGDLTHNILENNCDCGSKRRIIDEIVGRKYDMIRLSNNKVIHGEMINYLIKEITLKDTTCGFVHQFIQHSYTDFSLYIETDDLNEQQKNNLQKKIKQDFQNYLGIDYKFNLNIYFVHSIERANFGKHRYIISEL